MESNKDFFRGSHGEMYKINHALESCGGTVNDGESEKTHQFLAYLGLKNFNFSGFSAKVSQTGCLFCGQISQTITSDKSFLPDIKVNPPYHQQQFAPEHRHQLMQKERFQKGLSQVATMSF